MHTKICTDEVIWYLAFTIKQPRDWGVDEEGEKQDWHILTITEFE